MNPLTTQQKQELTTLIAEGEAVLASKRQPKSNIIGDWQSGETMYAVVDPERFMPWRDGCLVWLAEVVGENSETYEAFLYGCRRAQFLEAMAGQKLLLRLLSSIS